MKNTKNKLHKACFLSNHLFGKCPCFLIDLSTYEALVEWFQSFLSDKKLFVNLGNFSSSAAHLTCGIPQGSILAPSLFSLYMLPLGSTLRRHGVSFHFYADDTQIYLPNKRNDPSALSTLLRCLYKVKIWLAQNFTLNEDKTEVIVFSPTDHSQATSLDLGSLSAFRSSRVRNLGVHFHEIG